MAAILAVYMLLWLAADSWERSARASPPTESLVNYVLGGLCLVSLIAVGITDWVTPGRWRDADSRQDVVTLLAVSAAALLALAAAVGTHEKRWRRGHEDRWVADVSRLRTALQRFGDVVDSLDAFTVNNRTGFSHVVAPEVLAHRHALADLEVTWASAALITTHEALTDALDDVRRGCGELRLDPEPLVADGVLWLEAASNVDVAIAWSQRLAATFTSADEYAEDNYGNLIAPAATAPDQRTRAIYTLLSASKSVKRTRFVGRSQMALACLSEGIALAWPTPTGAAPPGWETCRDALSTRRWAPLGDASPPKMDVNDGLRRILSALRPLGARVVSRGGSLLVAGHLLLALAALAVLRLLDAVLYDPSAVVIGLTTAAAALLATNGVLVVADLETSETVRDDAIIVADKLWLALVTADCLGSSFTSALRGFLSHARDFDSELEAIEAEHCAHILRIRDKYGPAALPGLALERKPPSIQMLPRLQWRAAAMAAVHHRFHDAGGCESQTCVTDCAPYCIRRNSSVPLTAWQVAEALPVKSAPRMAEASGLMECDYEDPFCGRLPADMREDLLSCETALKEVRSLGSTTGVVQLDALIGDVRYGFELARTWGSISDGWAGPPGFSSLHILLAVKGARAASTSSSPRWLRHQGEVLRGIELAEGARRTALRAAREICDATSRPLMANRYKRSVHDFFQSVGENLASAPTTQPVPALAFEGSHFSTEKNREMSW